MAKDNNNLSPFVYWAQSDDKLTLRIDLRDAKEPQINIQKDKISFHSTGTGAKGFAEYAFEMDLYDDIKPKLSRYNVTGRQIDVVLNKDLAGSWWPKLVQSDQKLAWLKIDFDRWKSEDGEDDSSANEDTNNGYENYFKDDKGQQEQIKRLKEELASSRSAKDDIAAAIHENNAPLWMKYIFTYNLLQFATYLLVIVRLAYGIITFPASRAAALTGLSWKNTYLMAFGLFQSMAYLRITLVIVAKLVMHGQDGIPHMFTSVRTQIVVCQLAAILEIIHPLVGLVSTSVRSALMQVIGRNIALFLLILPEPRLQEKPVVPLLIFVWSLSELFRYPYYMLAILKKEYSVFTWLRYSMWIPLYPIGFVCEGVVMLRSLPYLEETGRLDVRIPSPVNLVLQFHYLLMLYMVIFIPGGFMLMNYMYKQRRHKVGNRGRRTAKLKTH